MFSHYFWNTDQLDEVSTYSFAFNGGINLIEFSNMLGSSYYTLNFSQGEDLTYWTYKR